MSRATPAHLEVLRLARLLGVDPDRLTPLADLPLEDLQALREQAAGRLFDEGEDAFRRAATVAGLVPTGLAAKLAEHALGPLLSARTTAVIEVDKAADLSSKLSSSYLADVAVQIDPRVVDELVTRMPPDVIAAVGDELAAREEWLVMADFLGVISTEALDATLHAVSAEAILHVAELLGDDTRLDEVVSLLSDDRLAELHRTAEAIEEQALLAELAEAVSPEQQARLAQAGADPAGTAE